MARSFKQPGSFSRKILAGLEEPDSGEICLKGEVIVSGRDGIFVSAEQRRIGLVFQSYAVWPHMTAFQNVTYPLEVRHWNRQEMKRKADQVLGLVGLTGLENRRPAELSGGQQQRLALARSLVYEPDLLLLEKAAVIGVILSGLAILTALGMRRLGFRLGAGLV